MYKRQHLGSLFVPFGPRFFGELAGLFRVGEKVAPGCQKNNFYVLLGTILEDLGDIFEDLGHNLTPSFLAMP